ncbi:MAG: hypothetical protein KAI24_13080, partial [Planctomycetes bacterium]|nr:hypothetical protein [Planctomycetota bacterium]
MLYTLVLAIGRDPLPGADERVVVPSARELPAPSRLTRIPGIDTSEIQPTDLGDVPARVTVPVQVDHVPESLRAGGAGVATFRTMTGGDFRWFSLDEAIPGPDGALLFTAQAPNGTGLTVTFAADREHARHGYISRRKLVVNAPDGRS